MDYEIDAEESVSEAVIFAVSAVEGCDPVALRPLADVVDPDALNVLFQPRAEDVPRTGGDLSFVYSHCRVTVYNGEYLTVQLLDLSQRDTRSKTPDGRRVPDGAARPFES